MSANSLIFYPLHATLLNFSEEYRQKHILCDRKDCAYLPVLLNAVANQPSNVSANNSSQIKGKVPVTKVTLSQVLYERIEFSLKIL